MAGLRLQFPVTRVALLSEMVEECLRLDVLFIIDIKCYDIRVSNHRPIVFNQIAESRNGWALRWKIVAICGDPDSASLVVISTLPFVTGCKAKLLLKCGNSSPHSSPQFPYGWSALNVSLNIIVCATRL